MKLGARLVLIGLVLAGCGDDDDDASSGGDRTAKVVAASLTSNVLFADGVVEAGEIPPTSASTVSLRQEDQVLSLAPETAQLLEIEVDNPDEDDDPVSATLMQFEDDDENHIEVPKKKSGGDGGTSNEISIEFEVDSDVCANLCNETFTLTMIQAVKLESGKISRHLKREIRLDCSDDGDPKKCEDRGGSKDGGTSGKGGSGASGKGGSSGGGSGTLAPTTIAMEFANALGLANQSLCKCPEFSMGACAAMLPQTALPCIQSAAEDAAAVSSTAGMLASLTARLNAAASSCASCDLTGCSPDLLADNITTLPSEVRGAFEQCATDKDGMIGGNLPDAGASP